MVLDIDRAPVEPGGHLPSNGSEAGGARPAGEEPRILRSLPAAPDTWKPLAGAALLDRLRITGRPRPKADPELTAKLRHDLEQGLSTGPGGSEGGCEVRPPGSIPRPGGHQRPTDPGPLARRVPGGRRVRATHTDCVHGLRRRHRCPVPAADHRRIDRRPDDRCLGRTLRRRPPGGDGLVDRAPSGGRAGRIAGGGGAPGRRPRPTVAQAEPGLVARTQEALRVGVADGAVELSARVDLAVGRPGQQWASVAIVEVKSGARRIEHRADLHFYALIEALRNPAPPFVVATYYTRTGELDVDPVTEELLVAAGRRTLAGIRARRQRPTGVGWRCGPSS